MNQTKTFASFSLQPQKKLEKTKKKKQTSRHCGPMATPWPHIVCGVFFFVFLGFLEFFFVFDQKWLLSWASSCLLAFFSQNSFKILTFTTPPPIATSSFFFVGLGWATLLDCSSPRVHHSNLGGSNLSLGTILMRCVTRPWEIMAATWRDCQNGPRRLAAVRSRCGKSWDAYRLVDLTGWLTGWRWWKWRRWWSFCSELVPLHMFFVRPRIIPFLANPLLLTPLEASIDEERDTGPNIWWGAGRLHRYTSDFSWLDAKNEWNRI